MRSQARSRIRQKEMGNVRTFTLRSLQLVQPKRDLVCARRVDMASYLADAGDVLVPGTRTRGIRAKRYVQAGGKRERA